jgi:serine/threonine protein phosphatase PrpC
MGTTVVLGVFRPGHVFIGHVGDSRCYRLRGGELCRLTRDHTLVQEQVDAGLVDPRLAPRLPYRNLLTRALGAEADVLPDLTEVDVLAGDLFLLCSDGLTDMLDDGQIAGLLAAGGPLGELGRALVEAANGAGGRDNVSVLLVRARM